MLGGKVTQACDLRAADGNAAVGPCLQHLAQGDAGQLRGQARNGRDFHEVRKRAKRRFDLMQRERFGSEGRFGWSGIHCLQGD
jgi:hypothetical protein